MMCDVIPAGLLLGMDREKEPFRVTGGKVPAATWVSGAAYLLRIDTRLGQWKAFSFGNNFVPVVTLLGAWLMNADRTDKSSVWI